MLSENSNLHNLSEEQIKVLTFLAYAIRPQYLDILKGYYYRMFRKNETVVKNVLKDLEKMGYVQRNKPRSYWNRESFEVKREWTLEVMRLLLVEHPDYIKKFKAVFSTKDQDNMLRTEYCFILKSIFTETKRNIELPPTTLIYLAPLFYRGFEDSPEILPYLPDVLLQGMVTHYAAKLINDDSGDGIGKLIYVLQEKVEIAKFSRQVLHLLQFGYVMQTGSRHEGISMNGTSCYSFLVWMLEAMANKDYETAVKACGAAVNTRDSERAFNVPPQQFPLIDLFYGMAVYMLRCKEYGNDLRHSIMLGLNGGYSNWLAAVRAFTDSLGFDLSQKAVMEISDLIGYAPMEGWIYQKLGMILAEWQGIMPEQIERAGCDKTLCDPKAVEYHAHATRLVKELLQTIPVRQQWERALDMIMSREGGPGGRPGVSDDKERTKRLAYFMTGQSYIEIREQTRLKSGRWSAGKRVSESRFYCMTDSFMDDVDMKVQDKVKSQRYSNVLSLSDILPCLKGSRKLYYGSKAPYANCDVVEGKPFITTHTGKDGISISSNLPEAALLDSDENHLLVMYGPNKSKQANSPEPDGIVTYYQVPVRLRQYIKALLAIGKFPLSAEPQLKQVFETIKGLVEIHSEMIEGGSTLPRVDGKTDVIIRILPVGDKYEVQAVVRPLENGCQTVLPGHGDSNVYDQGPDNVRYHVIRDKKQEKQNAKALCDFMDTADALERSPYVWTLDPYTLLELMEWLPEQGDDYVTEWPEGERIKLRTPDVTKWNIRLKEHAGWFDVEGELPIDENTVLGIGQLLNLMGEGRGRFVKLDNGQYLRLTESLRRQLQRIDSVANNVRGKMKISALGAGLIADYLDGDVEIAHPKKIDDLRKRIKKSADLQVEIPDELNATLRDYQNDGVQWMNRLTSWGAGACLADDMGLGKTVQSITFLLQKQKDGASMVVAPTSVVPNWKRELDRFAPTLNVTLLNDLSSDDRKEAIQRAAAGDVILTSYGLLISEEETLVEKHWNVVCLDEAHSIKNASTKTSAVCMRLQADNRLILTGTPIQNHLGELWNLFCFINPGLLGSYEQFTKKYINPIEGAHDKERQQQLRRIIQPFMLRRTKKEVVKELPDKQEITIPVELSKEELAIYELIRMEAKAQLEEDAGGNGAASINALAMITKLRMASCSASLVQKQWSGLPSKLSTFCDLVSEICTAGNRVLVFSQFTSFLEMARQQLESLGIKDYLYLDGSTPVKKRTQMVEQFQSGQSQLFLISLKAGGLGLNLTGANYVIHLDPWWNPAIEQQATDRAYRIGQKQQVTVYHLISEHTIEEKIVRLHQTKRDLADSLLDGTDMSHKLSAKDLLDMLQTDIL